MGPTKSIAISANRSLGIGSEWRNPAGARVVDLFLRQVAQELTYVTTSLAILGQKYNAVRAPHVLAIPNGFRYHDAGVKALF